MAGAFRLPPYFTLILRAFGTLEGNFPKGQLTFIFVHRLPGMSSVSGEKGKVKDNCVQPQHMSLPLEDMLLGSLWIGTTFVFGTGHRALFSVLSNPVVLDRSWLEIGREFCHCQGLVMS